MQTRISRRLATGALLALSTVLATLTPTSVASASTPDTGLAQVRALAVDPGTGRVFVAGDDEVVVLDAAGNAIGSIPEIYEASAVDATQGAIWVGSAAADTIVKINPVTLEVIKTYGVGAPIGETLTIVGNVAWIGTWNNWDGLGRFDLTTSTYQVVNDGVFYQPAVRRLGSSTSEVIVWERGLSSGSVFRMKATAPFDVTAEVRTGGYLGRTSVSVNDAGTRVYAGPTGNDHAFAELASGSGLAETGVHYQGGDNPRAERWSAAHGGILLGIAGDDVVTYRLGAPAPIGRHPIADATNLGALDVSPDGNTAYVAAFDGPGVQVIDLRPAVTGVSPTSVVRAVPAPITISGRALGGTTTVTVGGIDVEPTNVTTDHIQITVPAALGVGTHPVVVHGPTGDAATSLSVTANTGATLAGAVRIDGAAASGVQLTLSGGGLGSPATFTTAAAGTYSFGSLGHGSNYTLTVHDPADRAPDQVVRYLTLTPNGSTAIDIDLARPRANAAELRSTLGDRAVRDLLVDPATGSVVVTAGDEVDILDADGALRARLRGLHGANSLTMLDGDVFVGVAHQGRVARIDLDTRTVTGSWSVGRVTLGAIAAAGGKIWFVDGNDQWTRVRSLNLTTGAVTNDLWSYRVPSLRTVVGSPDRFTITDQDTSGPTTKVFDASTDPPTEVVKTPFRPPQLPSGELIAVSATGTVYDALGDEYKLADLTATGVHHDVEGPTAFSPAKGGVIAIGTAVARHGINGVTHQFAGTAAASGLDAAATRLYTASDGELVVHDLAPRVTGLAPEPIYPSTEVTVDGSGLGAATAVTVDGSPVPFEVVSATRLTIDLPEVTAGIRRVRVTTPWGTSDPAPIPVVAPGPPTPPRNPTVKFVSGEIRVSWQAPLLDGGRPVTGYKVTASPGGQTCTTAGPLVCAVPGLTPASTVTFTVTATNSKGTSDPSTATAPFTVPTAPDAPANVNATAGPSRATVTWESPASNGGIPVTGYRICTSTDPAVPTATATCKTVSATPRSNSVTGLTPGTTYYFTVAATNEVGTGLPSSPTTGVVPFTVAGSPTITGATAGVLSATLTWVAPADDGGSPINGYRLCATPKPTLAGDTTRCVNVGNQTSGTIDGLGGGRTYDVGSSRVDLQACKLEYSIVSPK